MELLGCALQAEHICPFVRGTAARPGSWGITNCALLTLSGASLWILQSVFHFHSHDNETQEYYLRYADKSVDFQEKEIISLMSHRKQEAAVPAR